MHKKDNALHAWVRKNKSRPEHCEKCGTAPPRDVANISGKYYRDVTDYLWLCRRCHMEMDGILYQTRGEGHTRHKLTVLEVLEIRIRYTDSRVTRRETQEEIARDYGVARSTISNIGRGWTWKSLG